MEDFLKIISNVGFPIAVAVYMLVKVQTSVEKFSEKINELSKEIENLSVIISNIKVKK